MSPSRSGADCPRCGKSGEQIDGALGKTAFACSACGERWACDHDGRLLWAVEAPAPACSPGGGV